MTHAEPMAAAEMLLRVEDTRTIPELLHHARFICETKAFCSVAFIQRNLKVPYIVAVEIYKKIKTGLDNELDRNNTLTNGISNVTLSTVRKEMEVKKLTLNPNIVEALMKIKGWEALDLQLAVRSIARRTPTLQTVKSWISGEKMPSGIYMIALEKVFDKSGQELTKEG